MESYAQFAICAVFIIGVTVFMVTRERELARAPRPKMIALALFGISAIAVGYISWQIVFAPAPIAEGDLKLKEGSIDFTVPSGAVGLRIDGETGDPKTRSGGKGGYTIEVKEGEKVLQNLDGNIDHHQETQHFMKRGVKTVDVKVEGRQDLPGDDAGKNVSLVLTREDGALRGPVHVRVIYSPPPDLMVFLVGGVLALIGAVLDRRMKEGAKSYVSVGVAFYFAFAMLLMRAEQPIEISHMAGIVLISLLCGAAVGGVFRLIVRPLVKPLPGSVPASK